MLMKPAILFQKLILQLCAPSPPHRTARTQESKIPFVNGKGLCLSRVQSFRKSDRVGSGRVSWAPPPCRRWRQIPSRRLHSSQATLCPSCQAHTRGAGHCQAPRQGLLQPPHSKTTQTGSRGRASVPPRCRHGRHPRARSCWVARTTRRRRTRCTGCAR